MKIRTKILLLFAGLTISTILVMSGLVYYFANQHSFEDFYKRLEIRAYLTAKATLPYYESDSVIYNEIREEHLEKLPAEFTRAGKLLRATIPYLFRSHRQHLGLESIRLPDAVCICALLHPELFHTEELAGDIETGGEITVGATIFDRRPLSPHRADIEVALEVDAAGVADCLVRSLNEAGQQT